MADLTTTITALVSVTCDCGASDWREGETRHPLEVGDIVDELRAELAGEGWSMDPVRCPDCMGVSDGKA